jgi:hypothetical protein
VIDAAEGVDLAVDRGHVGVVVFVGQWGRGGPGVVGGVVDGYGVGHGVVEQAADEVDVAAGGRDAVFLLWSREGSEGFSAVWRRIGPYLAMFLRRRAFRDYDIPKELFAITLNQKQRAFQLY